mgnify:CR=1 FL=1
MRNVVYLLVLLMCCACSKPTKLTILHTNDTHSQVEPKADNRGGYARRMGVIQRERAMDEHLLLVDAGDFCQGTPYFNYYKGRIEVEAMNRMGYDVVTLGNHEFDYKAEGLANMLNTAVSSGDPIPAIVVCNVDWDAMENAGITDYQLLLQEAFENYGIEEYIVVEKGDVKIAITGVFGEDCLDCVPNCPLTFKDPVEAVKETVEEIQEEEDQNDDFMSDFDQEYGDSDEENE